MPTPQQIKEQVERLCKASKYIPGKQADLLRYLTDPTRQKDFETDRSREILLKFEISQGYEISERTEASFVNRARRLVFELSRGLRLYYRELPPNAPDRVLIQIEAPRSSEDYRYKPTISDLVPEDGTTEGERFSLLGTNMQALKYVTDQIPKLNRIEETFVRWTERDSSLYAGSPFGDFLETLSASKLLYRAVLGPMTDTAVVNQGGLRDVLAKRVVEDLPKGETATKLYQLHHATALMNFTLLYYVEDESFFFEKTNHIEVLFGYGVHAHFGGPDSTVVFRSNDEDLVEEFQMHFDALRDERFSRRLDLRQPAVFSNKFFKCDVLATFPELPVEEIRLKTQASGGTSIRGNEQRTSDVERTERRDDYVPGRPHIKICVSALRLLDDEPFIDELRRALERGVQVSVAHWGPGPFLTARIKAARMRPYAASRESEGARDAVQSLGPHPNLFLRECFGEWASASIIWIDNLIYFSSYWIGRNVANGPHFLVTVSSETGEVLRDQYNEMIATSKLL